MHEMAIAQSVLDIAVGEMRRHSSAGIRGIKISVGEFSGVVKEALEFAFDVLQPDSPAAGAIVEIEVVPMKVKCPKCGPVPCRLNDLTFLCPHCGEPVQITAGRDMKFDYVDLD